MFEQIDERPAERREEVRHRRDVHEDHIAGDARSAHLVRLVRPGRRDAREERMVAFGARQFVERGADLLGGPGERGAFRRLVGARDRSHRIGMDECVSAVERVERGDEPLEPRTIGRAGTAPRREADAMPDPPRQREHVGGSRRAELGDRRVERALDVGEIVRDVVAAEQLVG